MSNDLSMILEAVFHRQIKTIATKREQGIIMGAFREAMAIANPTAQRQGEPVACQVEFIQGETPRVVSWNDHPAGVYQLYTHADTGEVERLRAELKSMTEDRNLLLNNPRSVFKQACDMALQQRDEITKERNTLRAQLASAQQACKMMLEAYDDGVQPEWAQPAIKAALAASADPSAPKCTYCGDTGKIMTGRSGDANDGNAPIMEPCEDCDGASVERDERADFEKAYTHAVENGWSNVKHLARLMWMTRAAKERNP